MTKQEIITSIEEMEFSYNEENEESYAFWIEAVKKAPEFLKEDIAGLRKEYKDMWEEDFSFSVKYAEILKPLNLNITVDEA